MSALAEALLAAQRQAIGALSKAYVAAAIDPEFAPATYFAETLNAIGCTDVVEQGQMLAALDVLRSFGVQTPGTNGATKPAPETEPASQAQWTLLRRLADEKGKVAPDGPLTKAQASAAINALKDGTYNSDAYTVPF